MCFSSSQTSKRLVHDRLVPKCAYSVFYVNERGWLGLAAREDRVRGLNFKTCSAKSGKVKFPSGLSTLIIHSA